MHTTPTSTAQPLPAPDHARRTDVTALVRRASAQDQAAWNELIDRYSGLLWSIARLHRLGPADAADVFQTTWLRLVEHSGALRQPEHVGAWLATTARRECVRLLRRPHHRELATGLFPDLESVDPSELDERLLRAERAASLWQACARLAPSDQALLRMLTLDPAPTYAEIATALNVPIGSIGPTRARCLRRLCREHDLLTKNDRHCVVSSAKGPA